MARWGGLKAAAYRGRSDVYRWLRKRHAKLVEMGVGQKDGPTWKAVAAAAAKAGQVNRRGEPPSEDNVRQVWSRVCRDEAAAKATEAKAQAAMFPTLRPVPAMDRPNIPPPVVTPDSRQVPVTEQRGDTRSGAGMLTELRRSLEQRSGKPEK